MEPTLVNYSRYLSDSDSGLVHCESIDEHINRIGVLMIQSYEVPSKNTLTGKLTHTYVPQELRAHIKALVDFVFYLHEEGKSLARFDESNLAVEGGMLKFRGLELVGRLRLEDEVRDFKFVHDIIKNLEKKHNPNNYKCESLDELLRLLLSRARRQTPLGSIVYKYMLKNHPALLSHETSLELMKSYSDNFSYIKDKWDRNSYYTAVEEMERSNINWGDWTKRFDGSEPGVGPAQDCFGFIPAGKVKTYQGTNRDILRFCRNLATHLQQHMWKHTTSQYDKKDVDLTIMALFETELLSFHELIFQHGISTYFIQGEDKTSRSVEQGSTRSYEGGRSRGFTPASYSTRQTSGPRRHPDSS